MPVYENVLAEKLTVPYSFAPAYMNRQRAAVVGTLAIQYYKSGKFETAEEHRPDYLRVSQAERERAQREKEAEITVRELKVEDSAAVAEMEQQIFSDSWSEKTRVGDCAAEAVCLLCGGKMQDIFWDICLHIMRRTKRRSQELRCRKKHADKGLPVN